MKCFQKWHQTLDYLHGSLWGRYVDPSGLFWVTPPFWFAELPFPSCSQAPLGLLRKMTCSPALPGQGWVCTPTGPVSLPLPETDSWVEQHRDEKWQKQMHLDSSAAGRSPIKLCVPAPHAGRVPLLSKRLYFSFACNAVQLIPFPFFKIGHLVSIACIQWILSNELKCSLSRQISVNTFWLKILTHSPQPQTHLWGWTPGVIPIAMAD